MFNIFDKRDAVDEVGAIVSKNSSVDLNFNSSSQPISSTQSISSEIEEEGLDAKLSKLFLVNPDNPLPDDYDYTGNLAVVDSKYISGYLNQLNSDIIPYVTAMIDAAREENVNLYILSPYRSYSKQETLYNNEVAKWKNNGLEQTEAENKAATIVARPGTSEHHTGLAIDFNECEDSFADTRSFDWLLNNAQDYGFILRYPENKQDITKIIYEPWHWRFVGIDVAKEIKNKGICFEEYIEEINNKESVAE